MERSVYLGLTVRNNGRVYVRNVTRVVACACKVVLVGVVVRSSTSICATEVNVEILVVLLHPCNVNGNHLLRGVILRKNDFVGASRDRGVGAIVPVICVNLLCGI